MYSNVLKYNYIIQYKKPGILLLTGWGYAQFSCNHTILIWICKIWEINKLIYLYVGATTEIEFKIKT